MYYKKRLDNVRKQLEEKRAEALLVKNSSNIFYLTGILETEGFLIVDMKRANRFVPGLYLQEASDKKACTEVGIYGMDDFRKFLSGYGKTAFISEELPYSLFCSLKKQAKTSFLPVPDILKDSRMIKEDSEIKLIKKALGINRRVFAEIEKNMEEGKSETEIAGEIHCLIRNFGGRREAFEPIVASGKNSAYPHHKNSGKRIKKNQPVVIDAGTDFRGYKSDLTRTFFCGSPSKKFGDIFKLLQETVDRTTEFVKPGKTGKEIHSFAVEFLKKKKLEQYFIHGLGHGVGIDVHEKPVLNSRSEDIMQKGCVVTVEPGIYIPGKGGVRIEEMVIVDR
ncbi:MAG TPA: Xaa-Pro peptidase family protein [bacterium]|nr:Xaa-Pro peptidase family protein [bacterium]